MSEGNKQYVIDRSKVKRAQRKTRKNIQNLHAVRVTEHKFGAFFFDGRKDQTRIFDGGQLKDITEDHYTVLKQPGSEYLFHVTTKGSTADEICTAITTRFDSMHIKYDDIFAIGCDGTVTNTGPKGGVIRIFEDRLHRPVQWLICLLHLNELPLRHLILKLDGKTLSPVQFEGPIGRSICRPEKEIKTKIVRFKKIRFDCTVPDIESAAKYFSADQKYLFDMCTAISSGKVNRSLARRSLGKLSMARWLTTANRILRVYISTCNPSATLRLLAQFIVQVYAPSYFNIMAFPQFTHGSRHLAEMIKRSRGLPIEAVQIINDTIERNGYFAHPENILIAMLDDHRANIREFAYLQIIAAKEMNENPDDRLFQIPKINFDCKSYEEMIDWQNEAISVPPILRSVDITYENMDVLVAKTITEHNFIPNLRELPCHTQSVERCVQIVATAAKTIVGEQQRNGHVLSVINSRKNMPMFRQKSHYKPGKPSNLPPKV